MGCRGLFQVQVGEVGVDVGVDECCFLRARESRQRIIFLYSEKSGILYKFTEYNSLVKTMNKFIITAFLIFYNLLDFHWQMDE